jgi:hypothetical protein
MSLEGNILKQAERVDQTGGDVSQIVWQLLGAYQLNPEQSQQLYDDIMRRLSNTGTNESHGALGKAQDPNDRVNLLQNKIASMRY